MDQVKAREGVDVQEVGRTCVSILSISFLQAQNSDITSKAIKKLLVVRGRSKVAKLAKLYVRGGPSYTALHYLNT
jgi:hypothetical protein